MVMDKTYIITHDNSMSTESGISEQLKRRRLALGLSLTEVARRAGTSAATLSRYEHGWTRFETHTLRKLALALNGELKITLSPTDTRSPPARTARAAAKQLARLFWDHPLTPKDLEAHPVWVVERVLEYGTLEDVALLRDQMGRMAFLAATASAHRMSPRTATFWKHMLQMEGIPCTKKYSRNTAWNS
jgi:transcriptional regulator with XRE-family HTH domain